MKITYFTRPGIKKNESEDGVLIDSNYFYDSDGKMEVGDFDRIAIADGVGGNKGGRVASEYVLKMMAQIDLQDENALMDKLRNINSSLIEYAKRTGDKSKMATTFTGLFRCGEHTYIAHVGNSRLYIKNWSYMRQLTHDHTTYQLLLDRGIKCAAEACNKSEIQACFGGGSENYLELIQVEEVFENGFPSRIILTTDGIHDYVSIDEMENLLVRTDNVEENIMILDELAIRNGSKDDRTIVVIDV